MSSYNVGGRIEDFKVILDSLKSSDYHGLVNLGATCYLNSVLQVLFMTLDFREAVERSTGAHSETIDAELKMLFMNLKKGTADTLEVTRKLKIKNTHVQSDAAEYFEKILRLSGPDSSKVFKGQLKHTVTCSKCQRQSDLEGLFWTLPLSMGDCHHQTFSVKSGFEEFFKRSKVSGDNKLFCNNCDIKADGTITCEITRHPDVLTLLLKRFQFDSEKRCYVKINCEVEMPQTLQTESSTYDLYAIVNHHGSLQAGHYTAYVKSYEVGGWYLYNDTVVTKVNKLEGSTKSNKAYLLMYRKVNQPAEVGGEGKVSTPPDLHTDDVVVKARQDAKHKHRAFKASWDINDRNQAGSDAMACVHTQEWSVRQTAGFTSPHKTDTVELDNIIYETVKNMNDNMEQLMKTTNIHLKMDQNMNKTERYNYSSSKDTMKTLETKQRHERSSSLSSKTKANNITSIRRREPTIDKSRDQQRPAWK